jgi:hypothetical protein
LRAGDRAAEDEEEEESQGEEECEEEGKEEAPGNALGEEGRAEKSGDGEPAEKAVGDERERKQREEEEEDQDVRELEMYLLRQLLELMVRLEAEAPQMLLDSMEKGVARTLLLADRNAEWQIFSTSSWVIEADGVVEGHQLEPLILGVGRIERSQHGTRETEPPDSSSELGWLTTCSANPGRPCPEGRRSHRLGHLARGTRTQRP